MTYLISGSIHARDMIFYVSMVSWVKVVSGKWAEYVTLTRDLELITSRDLASDMSLACIGLEIRGRP